MLNHAQLRPRVWSGTLKAPKVETNYPPVGNALALILSQPRSMPVGRLWKPLASRSQHRNASFVQHHKPSLRCLLSGLPHLSINQRIWPIIHLTKLSDKIRIPAFGSSFTSPIRVAKDAVSLTRAVHQLLPLSSLLVAPAVVDKATVAFLRALDATATPTYARNLHVLDSANFAELRGLRQTARNSAIRSPPSFPARLALLSVNMPAKKRKMDAAEQKYYAVRAGFKPGVYTSWTICQQQITGFKGAQCTLPLVSLRDLAR